MKPYFSVKLLAISALCCFCLACGDFQKAVEVPLPSYSSRMIAECYLENGKPYRLLLTESTGYFDGVSLPNIANAKVYIKHKGKTDTLRYKPAVLDSVQKIFNYQAANKVLFDPQNDYELYIQDAKGREAKAKTRFINPVNIDSISWKFDNKEGAASRAYLLIRFKDTPNQDNYYRLMVQKSNTNARPRPDFFFTDRLFGGEGGVLTGYNFEDKDTLFVTLYHIDKQFYQFLDTSRDAARANANPFALPSGVISNIEGGGTGIFTALSFDRRRIIIKK
jgi:hypothetical protein